MDLEKMTGKALGIAAAGEVMGWDRYGVGNDYPLFDAVRQKGAIFVLDSPELRWRQWTPWRDMNDAWEVVEKLIEQEWEPALWYGISDDSAWNVMLAKGDPDAEGAYWPLVGHCAAAPLAILRAALEAVRSDAQPEV